MIGKCSRQPEFMSFHCRESCGTCGFRSCKHVQSFWLLQFQTDWCENIYTSQNDFFIPAFNSDVQVVRGKQYTDKTKNTFSKYDTLLHVKCDMYTLFLFYW